MKKSPENTTVFIEISLIYEDFLESLKDREASNTEKFLCLLFAPVMLPVASIGILLGLERALSVMLSILASFLSFGYLFVYGLINYGPYLIQQLNTYVNG